MTPAAGQPGAGGVCEEETGEFRGPRHHGGMDRKKRRLSGLDTGVGNRDA